jgi:hypothetical protein
MGASCGVGNPRVSVGAEEASTMQALREVAETNGVTITEAVRWAVRLLKLVDDARRDGTEIRFVDPDTEKTRVLELL